MPKFQFVLHYQTEAKSDNTPATSKTDSTVTIEFDADKKAYAEVKVPDTTRPSTTDAVVFKELENFLSQQMLLGKIPGYQLHLQILQLSRFFLHSFNMYNFFNAEYAETVRAQLQTDPTSNIEPTTANIFKLMQKHGIYNPNLDKESEMFAVTKLENELQNKRKMQQERKSEFPSYQPFLLENEEYNHSQYDFFTSKLGITSKNNNLTPHDYLSANYERTKTEPLLYVRHCEQPLCTLNSNKSAFVKKINQTVIQEIVKFMLKAYPNKDEPLFYCGFASGTLLRDLTIIQELIIQGKYSRIQFCFLDTEYATLIQQTTEHYNSELSVDVAIKLNLISKAFMQFGEWIAAHVPNNTEPVQIHIFADIAQAERFVTNYQKFSLLVGEDYFCEDGTFVHPVATPDAHEHFMRLARVGLSEKGCFFESIKNDKKQEIYLHRGSMKQGKYFPECTTVYQTSFEQTKVYQGTSLGFFTGAKDEPVNCLQGKDKDLDSDNALDFCY